MILEGGYIFTFLSMRFLYKFAISRTRGGDEEVVFSSFFLYDHYNQHYDQQWK